MSLTVAQIQTAYVVFFGRPADPSGLVFWQGRGGTVADLYRDFASSIEYTAQFSGLNHDQTVNLVYRQLLGREAEIVGLRHWSDQLANGSLTVANLARAISDGAQGTDRITVDNRVAAATSFTNALDTASERLGFVGTEAIASARAWLATVDHATPAASLTGAAVDAAVTRSTTAGAGAVARGQTFVLTTGADNITGTSGNDTINGANDTIAGTPAVITNTLSAADVINGGAGVDSLSVTLSGTSAGVLNGADVKNVEILNVRNVGTGAATVDASQVVGLTEVNSDRSTGELTVTNLAAGATLGLQGNGVAVLGTVTGSYVAAATAATLNISGGTTGSGAVTITGTGLTSATVNSTGAANTIGALTGAASTTSTTINATTNLTTGAVTNAGATLNITGAGAVNLSTTALHADVTKLDASANTGGVTVALGAAVTQTVTGGSGNDVITSGAVLTTGSVNAGAGTDTLVLGTNVSHANTTALAAKYTNFETLRLQGTFDASLVAGITAVELQAGASTITKLSATQAGAITALDNLTATTLALATDTGTADVVNLTLGNGKGAAFDTGALTVNGIETLNIKANAKVGDLDPTSTIASFTADRLTAINLTGSAVTLLDAATTKVVTIDGSALTGTGGAAPVGLIVAGNLVTGSVVTGSAVADTMTAGTGFATYNGGAGKDTFNASAAQLNTGANFNVINGGDGVDTLNITGGVALTIVDNNLSRISGVERIVVATTADKNQTIDTGGWFDAAFRASGVDLTTTSTTGNITIDMTSFTGAAKISATTAGGLGDTGKITIQTGSGADDVTVNAVAAGGAGTVNTFGGNDKITTAGTEDFKITGGAGNDTIDLGSTGVNTLVFENTAALNGVDTITSFAAGADIIHWEQGALEVAVTGGALTTTANAFYQLGGLAAGGADTAVAVAAAVTAGATWTAAAVTAWIAVSDDNSTAIYQWTDVAGTAGVQVGEITLVGTIDAVMATGQLTTAITI